MLVCPSCGQENPSGAKFCLECGARLEAAPVREERKVVTVLFADLVGFTSKAEQLDPEDVRALLAPYHRRLRSELERFGGTVEKFIGDAVVALFGAPVAHEDDPERAVRAALAIREWVREEEEELQLRIAVNTGEALIALGARPEAGEGMASGDVVNTAARLQAAAPVNGILVGEATWRATRDRIDYVERAAVTAKGKAAAIGVWEPVQARSRVGMDLEQRSLTPLVGRDRELALLFEAFDRVLREREPQLLTLVGVPGIGKSRLVAELFQRIEQTPEIVWWRQGRALPYGTGVSFWALSEMVKAQAGIHENDDDAEAARKLRDSVAETVDEHERGWVLQQLEPLVGIGEESSGDRSRSFAAWRMYFEGLAEEHPLVLVFEDLHWADDGILDFVDQLVEWASGVPILVIGTARPELLDRRPNWGGGKLNAATVALSPLADPDAARVIGSVLQQRLLPAELQNTLLERAGGNPLYAEQFARLFLEHGSVEDLPAPENVQGIIAARLDALPAIEKAVLSDAAVLGKVFWLGGVASLSGLDAAALEDALHALARKGFIRRERRSAVAGESEFAFRHVLVREVGYGQIPRGARAMKHTAAAEWVEALGRVDDHAELLAYHYATALELAIASGQEVDGLRDRTRHALRTAGDRAALLHSHRTASELYARALDLWPNESDRAQLTYARARAEHFGGDTSGEGLQEAVDELLAAGFVESAAEAEALAAEAAWHRGERAEVDRRLQHAFDLVDAEADSPVKAWIMSQISRYAMLAANYDRALEFGNRALELATQLNLPEVRVHALNNVGSVKARSGSEGIADLEASIALAEEINSPELPRSLNNLASCLFAQGDVSRCLELELQSIAAAEKFGLESMARFGRANVIGSYLRLGMWNEVIPSVDALIAEQPSAGAEAQARSFRAFIRATRGDIAGALDDSTWVLELARRAVEPQSIMPALNVHAYVLELAGDEAGAREVVTEILERLESMPPFPFIASGEAVDIWLRHMGRDRVREVVESRGRETPHLVAARALIDGEFARAAELYREAGSLGDAAMADLRAAEELQSEGRNAEAGPHLQAALSFYRSVGATLLARRAEQLLAASA